MWVLYGNYSCTCTFFGKSCVQSGPGGSRRPFWLHFGFNLGAFWAHFGDFFGYIFCIRFWRGCHRNSGAFSGWCGALAAARRAKALESGREQCHNSKHAGATSRREVRRIENADAGPPHHVVLLRLGCRVAMQFFCRFKPMECRVFKSSGILSGRYFFEQFQLITLLRKTRT